MNLLRLTIFGLPIILLLNACTLTEKPPALELDSPIQHFDILEGEPKPIQFDRAHKDYLSNANSINKFELRYYPIDDIVEFEQGWLVSGGKGEWGGILYWLGRNGDLDILIKNSDNPSDVAFRNDATYIAWSPFLPLSGGHSDLVRVRKIKGEIDVEKYAVPGAVTGFERRMGDLWVKTSTWHPDGVQTESHRIGDILSQTKTR